MSRLDDSGVAYGYIMAMIFLVFAGIILAIMSQVVNPLIVHENKYIENGEVSVQTKVAFNWNVGAFVLAPVITLIVVLYWAVNRPIEQVRYGGGQ